MTARLCSECSAAEALPRKQRCAECFLAAQPVTVRLRAAEERLALVPEGARRARVPERDWPPGRRWCASCQSFVRLADVARGGKSSRCSTCEYAAGHLSRIKAQFGLSPADWERLNEIQGGRCAICRNPPRKYRFQVDHDHRCAECGGSGCPACVRGLTCSRCNHELLPALYHSAQIARNAVAYLETPPAQGSWSRPEGEGDDVAAPF